VNPDRKGTKMDKWEKITLLHRRFKDSQCCVPLRTILTELECSEATFHRLRAYMQDCLGAPIVFNRAYGGYQYDPKEAVFELPGLWFTKKETEALLSLDYAIESMQGGFFHDIIAPVKKRLESLLREQKTTVAGLRDHIKIIPIQSRLIDEAIFRTIASAVVRTARLSITHFKLTGKTAVERTISPQTLVRYRDNWYVDAWCHLRNELRTFALDRLTKAEPAPGKYRHVARTTRETFFADSYGIFTGPASHQAIIEFIGTAAQEVSREQWHPKQKGEWTSGETVWRLTVPYGNSRELVMDILKWGELAIVKEPQSLREEIKGIIVRMKKNY